MRRLPLFIAGQVRSLVDHLAVAGNRLDVRARAEGPPSAGDDENPDVVVVFGFVVCVTQLGDHMRTERIESVRAVQGDRCFMPVHLVLDGVV